MFYLRCLLSKIYYYYYFLDTISVFSCILKKLYAANILRTVVWYPGVLGKHTNTAVPAAVISVLR